MTDLSMAALRIHSQPPGAWWVAISPTPAADMDALADVLAEYGRKVHQGPLDALAGEVYLSLLDAPSTAQLQSLDMRRDAWVDSDTIVVLLMTAQTWGQLSVTAPHLSAWLRGNLMQLNQTPTPVNVEERLDHLRQMFCQSDEEVISLAQQHKLSADPHYAEWLVLLGQGGLLGPGPA
jgi:hypothetical protein